MKRASIRQVAERAQVSPMTVSNVIHGRQGMVSAKTASRVRSAIRALDYVPVSSPVQNRHVETSVIGIVFDRANTLLHPATSIAFAGVCEAAAEAGYDLLTLLRPTPDWAPGREEVRYLDKRADGFIFVNPYAFKVVMAKLVEHGVPAVSCFGVDVPEGVGSVVPDNGMAVTLLLNHLRSQGHRRIAHLAGSHWHSDAVQRARAFQRIMAGSDNAECVEFVYEGDWHNKGTGVTQLLDDIDERGITAVVCGNDMQAFNLWDGAMRRGIAVPHRLSIVGIDDCAEAAFRGLTTVVNPFAEIGKKAVETLIRLKEGADPHLCRHAVPMRLVERQSVAAVN